MLLNEFPSKSYQVSGTRSDYRAADKQIEGLTAVVQKVSEKIELLQIDPATVRWLLVRASAQMRTALRGSTDRTQHFRSVTEHWRSVQRF